MPLSRVVGLLLAVPLALAQPVARGGEIFTCVDPQGRRLTSDRPIPECNAREQRILNRDGSLKGLRQPAMTAEERSDAEARERQANEARLAQAELVRRDRNLLQRYRNEAVHLKAREDALDAVRQASKRTWARLDELLRERKPLNSEAEFYAGRTLPPVLRGQIDANEVSLAAVSEATRMHQAETDRINRLFDTELDRLRRLWAGAAPGSLGPMQVPPASPATPAAPAERPGAETKGAAPSAFRR